MFESLFNTLKTGLEKTEKALGQVGVPIDEATLNELVNRQVKAPIKQVEVRLHDDGACDLKVHVGGMVVAQRLYVEKFVVNAHEASVHLRSKGLIQNPIVGVAAAAMVRAVLLSSLRAQFGEDLAEDAVRVSGQDIFIDLQGSAVQPAVQKTVADMTGLTVPAAGVRTLMELVEIRGVVIEAGRLRVQGGLTRELPSFLRQHRSPEA